MNDDENSESENLDNGAGSLDGVTDTPDGGALVALEDEDSELFSETEEHVSNLAETLPQETLKTLATDFLSLIEKDAKAREKRDVQYEEGIRRTGLGDDAPGGAQFSGASKVVHPMLTKACVDFSSRSIKELFPPDGPVKTKIIGAMTKERSDKAKRKAEFMNWQFTTQSQNFRAELEQLLTQVPLGGAQYMKVTWDSARNRPEFLFVAIDEMLLPYAATNFYSAQRKTHVQYLTQLSYDQRVKSGMYRDADLLQSSEILDQTKSAKANDKVEGREIDPFNSDGLRTVFEIFAYAEIENDEYGPSPYIITIDKYTREVLSIYRNWAEEDDTREQLEWVVEFPFVPWRGAYPIGITHMIGGLSAAATGALRALLDSAHISNSQTMLSMKGASKGGQSINLQPTQVAEIEAPLNIDDIRKIAMPLPFNQPSPVLFQLLGFLVENAESVVRTTMDNVADNNQNAPVGTTLAKIEQGMVVFNAIHARLHDAMGRLMRILHRLNGLYLSDMLEVDEIGEELAKRSDFLGPMDVVPISDPNIFSEAQRFAQVQAVAQRAQLAPDLYDRRKVEQRILATLKIPDAESLLAPNVSPEEKNPIEENVLATLGQNVQAFQEQDHISHLKAHLAYMTSPALGASDLMSPTFTPLMINHIKEHMALWYATEVMNLVKDYAGNYADLVKQTKTPEAKRAMEAALAEASLSVVSGAQEAFAILHPVIKQSQEAVAKLLGPPPQDPSAAAAMADIEMRRDANAQKVALDSQKLQLQQQQQQQETQAASAEKQAEFAAGMEQEQLRQQAETARSEREMQARIAMNTADNNTAMQLALLDLANGNASSDAPQNPNPNPTP